MEEAPLFVSKREGVREAFDRSKIEHGLAAASKGRPLCEEAFADLALEVEEAARLEGCEVTSEWVGRAVLERLRGLDQVAALRFASVYKGFSEVADFEKELSLIKRDEPGPSLV